MAKFIDVRTPDGKARSINIDYITQIIDLGSEIRIFIANPSEVGNDVVTIRTPFPQFMLYVKQVAAS